MSAPENVKRDSEVARPREILRRFGVTPSWIRRRPRGGRNVHWVAMTRTGLVVLRRCAAECTLGEVEYELRILEHLENRQWPVGAPLAAPIATPGGIWCLFRYVVGRSPKPRTARGNSEEQRRRGRLLARLHADLADLSRLGQRPGWRRTDEGLFDRTGKLPADAILQDYERRAPEAGRMLRGYRERMQSRFAELLPSSPAPIVIHGDLTPWNIRYESHRLSGVFDFDAAHLDLRVADFALAWRGRHADVLRGYEEQSPLDPIERELVVPVFWAWMIACALADIETGVHPRWALEHLVRQPESGYPLV